VLKSAANSVERPKGHVAQRDMGACSPLSFFFFFFFFFFLFLFLFSVSHFVHSNPWRDAKLYNTISPGL
jgi:hypothetical protein